MQKTFLWKNSTPKIKHGLFVMAIWPEDFKNVDISNIFIALQCSWIRKLYIERKILSMKVDPALHN